ncbi:MAG: efflux transporter outer membrane subunit [Desulfobacterota bacterium]|nr:efflux transporter outer membrane subunit [Thermodesulfobacteriota bacterium]
MFVYIPVLMLGVSLLTTGCTLAPPYTRPEAPVPGAWPKGEAYRETPVSPESPAASGTPWQEFFADEGLRQAIATALKNNRDLRLAALNVERARALYGIQRGELFPVLEATGGGSQQRIPGDLSSTGQARTTEQYNVNLGLSSWEIDFFGRIRSLRDRALEEFLATEEARRSAEILLVSTVAGAYLTLAADRENLTLSRSTWEAQEKAYELVKRRQEVGLASAVDLYRARIPVDTARGDVARFTQLVAQDENALNVLLGTSLSVLEAGKPADLNEVRPPREISAGLSSEVLLRRPDILSGEHRLKAAYANIGAARAAFFPRITLTTSIGTASSELSGLFGAGQDTWFFNPQVKMPIFDARLWSALEATKVQREIAVTEYEKAIQTAFREVADTLAIRGTVDRQLAAQQSLVEANAETYRLAQARYNKGLDSFLSVLDAQRSLYGAQQGLVGLRLAKIANQVRLYAVLGGGSEPDKSRLPAE